MAIRMVASLCTWGGGGSDKVLLCTAVQRGPGHQVHKHLSEDDELLAGDMLQAPESKLAILLHALERVHVYQSAETKRGLGEPR